MLLCRRGECKKCPCNRFSVAREVLVSNAWHAVVDVDIADEPIVVLKFLDVIEAPGEKDAESSSASNILLGVHPTSTSGIRGLENIVANLEVTAEFLSFCIFRLKWEAQL